MKLTIEMELDNAAFADDGAWEVLKILLNASKLLPERLTPYAASIRDTNGNTVGSVIIAE